MKHFKKNSKTGFALIVAISATIVFLAFLEFGTLLKRDLKTSTETFLSELNIQHSNALLAKINNTTLLLDSLAAHSVLHQPIPPASLPALFAEPIRIGAFQLVTMSTPDGMTTSSDGSTRCNLNEDFFKKAMLGRKTIQPAPPGTPNSTGDSLILSIPLQYRDRTKNDFEQVTGVLQCVFSLGLVQTLFDDSFLKDQGSIYIIDNTGKIVLSHPRNQVNTDNILNLIRQTSPEENSIERVTRDLQTGHEGSADFSIFGEKHYADYRPLGINDWFVVSTISDSFISKQSKNIAYLAILLCFFVVLAFSLLLGYILRIEHRSSLVIQKSREELNRLTGNIPGGVIRCLGDNDFTLKYASDGFLDLIGYTREALDNMLQNKLVNVLYPPDIELFRARFVHECSSEIEIENRLVRQDGTLIWVTCKGKAVSDAGRATPAFDCVLLDITDRKKNLEDLYLSEERHRLLTEATDTVVYEYDILRGRLTLSDKWNEKFAPLPDRSDILKALQSSDLVHEKDKPALFGMLESLRGDTEHASCEFRLKDINGDYIWCQSYAVLICDKDGRPSRLLGRINDINQQKQEQEKLEERARRDPLSGLYNKGATVSLIEATLEHAIPEEHHALMIIDIDNFKSINDNLGHLFGDAVLSGIANDLKKLFRTSDIIGRIGGDEFVVFLRNVGMESFIAKISHTVCETLQTTFSGEKASYTVSASIGVSIYPQHGTSYSELFKKADTALYQAKEHGKNRYVIYDTAMEFCLFAEDVAPTDRITQRVPTTPAINHDLVAQLIEMFYDVKDINVAIAFALRYVGRLYSIKRAFIAEMDTSKTQMVYTYEWCADGVLSLKDTIKAVPFADAEPVITCFNEGDMLASADTSSLPVKQARFFNSLGVLSIVVNPVREEGKFKGVIGFEENEINRIWTKEEMISLSLASKIIGMSLIKMRVLERLRTSLSITEAVMNMQTLWVYVINKETHELLYLNRKTQEFAPDSHIGDCCYKKLMGRDMPCSECPLNIIEEHASPSATAIIENLHLKMRTEVTMSQIPWNGTDQAYLVYCVDAGVSASPALRKEGILP